METAWRKNQDRVLGLEGDGWLDLYICFRQPGSVRWHNNYGAS